MIRKPHDVKDPPETRQEPENGRHAPGEGSPLSSLPSDELIRKLEIAEQKLSFLGLVVASSVESIVTVDFDGIITTWNASAERLYGYPAKEAVGKPLTMLTLPEDLLEILSNIDSIKHGKAVEIYDTVRIRKGGDEIDLEILMSPVTSAEGNVIGVATIARDITERVRLTEERGAFRIAELERKAGELEAAREHENRLAESQMRLAVELSAAQHLQKVSTQMIGEDDPKALYDKILDASTQIMRAQYASLQILYPERGTGGELWLLGYRGFSPGAAKYWEWVTPDSECSSGQALRTGARVVIPNIEADRQMIGSEDRSVYAKDQILAVQTTPLISRGGRLLGMISTHWNRPHTPSDRDFRLLDVLARQAADLIDRNQAEEIIRQSEEKYRTLFESIDEGFCLLEVLFDASGEAYDYVFLEANAAFERQSGRLGAVGRSILELVPGLEAQWVNLYGRVVKTGKPVRFEAEVTSMARVFDIYATRSAGNNVAVVFTDISERKRREADLAFLADVSADLVQQNEIGGMMEVLGAKIGEHFGATRLGFFELNEAADEAVCEFDWHASPEDISLVGTHRIADFYTDTGEFARTMRLGEAFVLGDGTADSRLIPASLVALNIRSFVAIPDGGRRPQLALALYDNTPRDWTKDEVSLLRELTARIWSRLEQARAEEALRESRERLGLALDAAEMGTFLWHPQEDRTDMDARALRVLGLREGDTMTYASALTEAIHPDDRELYAAAVAAAIDPKGGRKLDLDYRVVHPDRSVHWLHLYGHTLFVGEDSPTPAVMYGMVLDITERKRAEEALRESEEKYFALFAASPAPFLILAPDAPHFTITAVNDAYLAATMRTREELIGLGVFEAFPDNPEIAEIEGVSKLRASLKRVLATRKSDTLPGLKYDIVRPDGTFEERFWSPVNSAVIGKDGEVVSIIHNANDVTASKRAEEALRESEVRQAFLLEFGDALRTELDADAMTNRALRMLMEHMQLDRCYVGIYRLAEDIGEFPHQAHDDRLAPLPPQVRLSDFPEALGVAFERTLVIDDIVTMAGLSDIDKATFIGLGMGALIVATLRKENGPLWAINAVSTRPRVWTQGEISLVEEVAERTWAAAERARAEETLRLSEGRLQVLLDETPMGVYLIDADFRIVAVNPTSLPVFAGIPDLIGRDFEEVIHQLWSEEYADEVVRLFRHTLDTGESYYTPERTEERQDLGVTEYYEWWLSRIPLPDGRDGVVCYFRDVSAQVFSRLAVAASEEKYRTLFESIDEAFCTIEVVFDEKGKAIDYLILETNPAFVRQSGLEDAVGKTMREIAPTHEEFWYDTYGHIARTGKPKRLQHAAVALGKFFDVYAFRIGEPSEHRVAVIFNDITERKRAEEELRRSREGLERRVKERTRELAEMNTALQAENLERRKIEEERVGILRRLMTAQEDVRGRIARDLHDQLGQNVTALRLQLEAAAKIAADTLEIKDQIGRAQEFAKRVDADVGFLTFELRPTALDDLGLIEAIRIFLQEWSRNHNVAAEFYSRPFEVTLPPEAEINVYRIVQEALNNTMKHAMAKHVAVHLHVKGGSLVLIVEDDGIGFDQNKIAINNSSGGGLGLIGMRERCLLIGGNLEIESALGKGTVIFARIPVNVTGG